MFIGQGVYGNVCKDWKNLLALQLMEIGVKNMVCDRCVMVVADIMRRMGYPDARVTMGSVSVDNTLSDKEFERLDGMLVAAGFELLRDRESSLVDSVKREVILFARNPEVNCRMKLSAYLAKRIGIDYRTLGKLFAGHENRTIERYYIAQKVEYVKELLAYGNMTVSEIADMTGYSSVAHLSRQFRDETGITPTQYRMAGQRKPLDKV